MSFDTKTMREAIAKIMPEFLPFWDEALIEARFGYSPIDKKAIERAEKGLREHPQWITWLDNQPENVREIFVRAFQRSLSKFANLKEFLGDDYSLKEGRKENA